MEDPPAHQHAHQHAHLSFPPAPPPALAPPTRSPTASEVTREELERRLEELEMRLSPTRSPMRVAPPTRMTTARPPLAPTPVIAPQSPCTSSMAPMLPWVAAEVQMLAQPTYELPTRPPPLSQPSPPSPRAYSHASFDAGEPAYAQASYYATCSNASAQESPRSASAAARRLAAARFESPGDPPPGSLRIRQTARRPQRSPRPAAQDWGSSPGGTGGASRGASGARPAPRRPTPGGAPGARPLPPPARLPPPGASANVHI